METPIGQIIKKARQGSGLTQHELGERLGIAQNNVSLLERNQNIETKTLERVAKALGLKLRISIGE